VPTAADVNQPTDPGARSRRVLIVAVAAVVIALDAIGKALAVHYLSGRGVVDLLGGRFHLELYRNFAGPRNTLTGHPVTVSLLALASVIGIAIASVFVRTRTLALAFGLLLGGGIGNLIDRLARAPGPLRGGVVDWLKPTLRGGSMNIADVAVSVALVLIVLGSFAQWIGERRESQKDEAPAGQAGASHGQAGRSWGERC
jgi:signal peptidase II